jgi:hypothetical protein
VALSSGGGTPGAIEPQRGCHPWPGESDRSSEVVLGKTPIDEALDRMPTEDLEALVQWGRHLRAVNESNEEAV